MIKGINKFIVLLFLFLFYINCVYSEDTKTVPKDFIYSTLSLSDKLNNLEMYEDSFHLLDGAIKKDPGNRDLYLVQKAATFIAMKKLDEADKAIKSLDKPSKTLPFTQMVIGIKLVTQGKHKEAIPYLQNYCNYVKENPPKPEEEYRRDQFQKAVAYLQHAYKEAGLNEEIEHDEVMVIPINHTKIQELLRAARVVLDRAEKNRNDEEELEKTLELVIADFDKIIEDESVPEKVAISVVVEKFRCLVLLGRLDEAEKLINNYEHLIIENDKKYKDSFLSERMYLWSGEMNYALGEKEEDKHKKVEYLLKSMKDFFKVFDSEDSEKNPYATPAVNGFKKAKGAYTKIPKCGLPVKLSPGDH